MADVSTFVQRINSKWVSHHIKCFCI